MIFISALKDIAGFVLETTNEFAVEQIIFDEIFGPDPLKIHSEDGFNIKKLEKEFCPNLTYTNLKEEKESYLLNTKLKNEKCVTISASGVKITPVKKDFPVNTGISISKSGVKKSN